MQMFYTPFSSNAQNHHKQRKILSPIPTPPESLKLREDLCLSGFVAAGGRFWYFGIFTDILGFLPRMFYTCFTVLLCFTPTNEKVRQKGLKTVEKLIINNE